jgi:hypothetical protein
MKELIEAMQDNYSKWAHVRDVQNLPETETGGEGEGESQYGPPEED